MPVLAEEWVSSPKMLTWELHAEQRCSWGEVSGTSTRQLEDLWALWPVHFLSLTHTALADSTRTLSLHLKILSQARTEGLKSPRGVWQVVLPHASWLGDTE